MAGLLGKHDCQRFLQRGLSHAQKEGAACELALLAKVPGWGRRETSCDFCQLFAGVSAPSRLHGKQASGFKESIRAWRQRSRCLQEPGCVDEIAGADHCKAEVVVCGYCLLPPSLFRPRLSPPTYSAELLWTPPVCMLNGTFPWASFALSCSSRLVWGMTRNRRKEWGNIPSWKPSQYPHLC